MTLPGEATIAAAPITCGQRVDSIIVERTPLVRDR
jgi:hypothetical protein